MFSGIVETMGTIVEHSRNLLVVAPKSPLGNLATGESISIDGACLTLEKKSGGSLVFRLLPETLRATTLGRLKKGDQVNLERSLRVGDPVGGHLLLGHVDGQGNIVGRVRKGDSLTLEIDLPRELVLLFVPKGPIGVDGVSLTLDPKVSGQRVRVHLVAHTLSATTLGKKPVGARVNLEVDLVAKYLRAMI